MSVGTHDWRELLDVEAEGEFESLDVADQIDVACDVFEALYRDGVGPAVEEFLPVVDAAHRDRVMRELVPLEFEYRATAGDVPTFSEFFTRFPNAGLFLARFFCDPEVNSQQVRPLQAIAGKYWLLEEVGVGSSGRVYRGYDDGFHRFVAVKLPVTTDDSDEQSILRFETEAKNAGSVSSDPGIVSVHEVGEYEGRPFIISDFVEGKSLAKHLSMGTHFGLRDTATLVAKVAETMDFAHRQSIIHRDLKPGNIMLEDSAPATAALESKQTAWNPKVLDFGLAQRQDGSLKTVFGAVLGNSRIYES